MLSLAIVGEFFMSLLQFPLHLLSAHDIPNILRCESFDPHNRTIGKMVFVVVIWQMGKLKFREVVQKKGATYHKTGSEMSV